ncbi:hypothetical protein B5E48_05015 [Massilimicrobiota sp. An105]|uniref:lipopolysaccharide biosynthesis protein n=1 Tax=Massilimicrobiota sp. An105 TaxID=1965540 RepID=UPI000B384E76|nr:MATE family efflux transporter [Massilimicrobiota sp. An105]OUQ80744.1 hypothetical protein B5E48_05015 [Massilimicrobiota sp. An105]
MKLDNQNKKTMLSLASSLIAMILSMVISFVLSPYIVSNFGEEANGFTQLANNFINYATLITVALNSMAGRFITVAYCKKQFDDCRKFYSSVLVGNIIIIAVLLVPAMFFSIKLDNYLNVETAVVSHIKLLFALVFANFFVSQINGVFSIAFYVKNVQYLQNIINMVRTVVNAGGLIILFTAFSPKIYYVSLVAVVLSCALCPVFLIYKKKIMPDISFDIKYFDLKAVWVMVSSGVWNTVTQCGNLLMTGLDLLLCNLFISPVQMGVLSIAKTIPNTIIQLGATVNTNFSPNLTIAYAEGDKNKIISSLRYAMKCSSILTCIPIVILCVYGLEFYSLWVPSMDASQLTVLSFLSCMMLIPFAGPQVLFNVFTTTNRLKLNSISVLLGGVVNFAVVFLLLKYTDLGLVAVTGGSSVVSIIRNLVITVPYSAKLLNLKWYVFYQDVLQSCVLSVLVFVVCMLVKKIIQPSGWFLLICSILVAGIISVITALMVILNASERKLLCKKILRR